MNPEQLWETAIAPASGRLMQVKIEDAVTADEIFRYGRLSRTATPSCIEKNAFSFANLDI